MRKLRSQTIKFFRHIIKLLIHVSHKTFLLLELVSKEIMMLKLQKHEASNIIFDFIQPPKVRINVFMGPL